MNPTSEFICKCLQKTPTKKLVSYTLTIPRQFFHTMLGISFHPVCLHFLRLNYYFWILKSTKSQQEIADLVGVSRKRVITTKRNYEKTPVVKELPRSGRPRKLTSRDESYIFR
ncbi:hypothetical protein BpHYR1_011470 [Brachionus plicatilis]|uniref:Homeodomain-like DNA binding domain-containing transcription factor n=1 Tax=Brachionus plicatilis TaxID=10195 RepID=A0A3M7QEC6_BRAPC|nr:hypothetical protein BpHYR1_011470 [Brachionus plicatilis]